MAEGFEGDQAAFVRDCYGGGGEGAVSDGVFQDDECALEKFVLILEGVEQGRWRRWIGAVQVRVLS
jgi:hypothetical protein